MHGGSGSFHWKHAGTMAKAHDYIHLFLSRMKENVLILCTATKYIEYKLLNTHLSDTSNCICSRAKYIASILL